MLFSTCIAILAPIFTSFQLVPQLYKTYTSRSVADLSLESIVFITLGNLLWLAHGYFIRDASLLIAGIIATAVNLGLVTLYLNYRR